MACLSSPREGVAEFVERSAARDNGLLVGRQRLGHVDQHEIGQHPTASDRAEQAGIVRGRSQRRPPAARAPAPASPRAPSRRGSGAGSAPTGCRRRPAQPNQRLSRRLASAMALRSTRASPTLRSRPSAKKRVGSWQVAHERRAVLREPRIGEQLLAERDGRGIAGDAVARVARDRRRPGPMRQDCRPLGVAEGGWRLAIRSTSAAPPATASADRAAMAAGALMAAASPPASGACACRPGPGRTSAATCRPCAASVPRLGTGPDLST